MVNPNYKLENMLKDYQQCLSEEKKENFFLNKSNDTANLLMNIILIGAENLTDAQVKALKNFHNSYSENYYKDKVVNLISTVLNSLSQDIFKINYKINSCQSPDDVKTVFETFKEITDFNSLSQEIKLKVASYAMTRLQDAKNEFFNYADLSQFIKILSICWNEPYLTTSQNTVITCLLDLIKDIKPGDGEFALEFKNIAITLIKTYENTRVPADIKNTPAYHGGALNEGILQLEEVLGKTGTAKVSLQDFAIDYCQDYLKAGEYLIRNSSTIPSTDAQGSHYFTITISYKNTPSQLLNVRLTRIEAKDSKISWKWGTLSQKDFEKGPSFNNIEEAINARKEFEGFKPSMPPNTEAVIGYIFNRYA